WSPTRRSTTEAAAAAERPARARAHVHTCTRAHARRRADPTLAQSSEREADARSELVDVVLTGRGQHGAGAVDMVQHVVQSDAQVARPPEVGAERRGPVRVVALRRARSELRPHERVARAVAHRGVLAA